jgi:hypothetical protein
MINLNPDLQNLLYMLGGNANQDIGYSSGQRYAQSIAGGENVPGMIAPGVSYSAARPEGYTQADLTPAFYNPGPVPVMPSAPTQGNPLTIENQMPYAPPGVTQPERYTPMITNAESLKNLADLFNANLPNNTQVSFDPFVPGEPMAIDDIFPNANSSLIDFTYNPFNEINEPVDNTTTYTPTPAPTPAPIPAPLDNLFTETTPGIFSYEPLPDSELVSSTTTERNKGALTKTETMRDGSKRITNPDGSVTIVPASTPTPAPTNDNFVNANSSPIKFDESTGNISFFSEANNPLDATIEAGDYLTTDQINSGDLTINFEPVPNSERVVNTEKQIKSGVLQYQIETMADGSTRLTNKDGSVEIIPPPAFTDNILPVDVNYGSSDFKQEQSDLIQLF